MKREFEFESISGVAVEDDGKHIVIHAGDDKRSVSLRLPAIDAMRIIGLLAQAASEAMAQSRSKGYRAIHARGLALRDDPNSQQVQLLVRLQDETAPLAIQLPRTTLLGFAKGLLESRGLLPVGKPDRTQ